MKELAWAERTSLESMAQGAWYVYYSDDFDREYGIRATVATFGLPPFGHPSPSANEEAARKVARYINEAYQAGLDKRSKEVL